MAEHWGPKSFLVLCSCGFSFRTASAAAADNTATWHREQGCEGCDHVMFVGYDGTETTPAHSQTEDAMTLMERFGWSALGAHTYANKASTLGWPTEPFLCPHDGTRVALGDLCPWGRDDGTVVSWEGPCPNTGCGSGGRRTVLVVLND